MRHPAVDRTFNSGTRAVRDGLMVADGGVTQTVVVGSEQVCQGSRRGTFSACG